MTETPTTTEPTEEALAGLPRTISRVLSRFPEWTETYGKFILTVGPDNPLALARITALGGMSVRVGSDLTLMGADESEDVPVTATMVLVRPRTSWDDDEGG